LSQIGRGLYTTNCSQCHGPSGQGITSLGTPALWGSGAQIGKYLTAQGLLDYVVSTKPPGAPGTLPHETYVDVICYILIQNNEVSSSTTFSEPQLSSVALK
jgi:mono/diheme cytochrome c family protein